MGWTMWPTKVNIMAAGRQQNRVSHEALGFSLEGCDYRASSRLYMEFPGLWTQIGRVSPYSILQVTVKVLLPLHLPSRIEEGLPVPCSVASG